MFHVVKTTARRACSALSSLNLRNDSSTCSPALLPPPPPASCSSASPDEHKFPSAGMCQERHGSWWGSRSGPICGHILLSRWELYPSAAAAEGTAGPGRSVASYRCDFCACHSCCTEPTGTQMLGELLQSCQRLGVPGRKRMQSKMVHEFPRRSKNLRGWKGPLVIKNPKPTMQKPNNAKSRSYHILKESNSSCQQGGTVPTRSRAGTSSDQLPAMAGDAAPVSLTALDGTDPPWCKPACTAPYCSDAAGGESWAFQRASQN